MKLAKPGILYVAGVEKLRANDCSTMVISAAAAITKPCPGRHLARFCASPPRGSLVGSPQASPLRQYRGVALYAFALRQPPKEIVVDRVARGEAVGDLPKNCHLLPSTAILEPQSRWARYNRFVPYLASMACRDVALKPIYLSAHKTRRPCQFPRRTSRIPFIARVGKGRQRRHVSGSGVSRESGSQPPLHDTKVGVSWRWRLPHGRLERSRTETVATPVHRLGEQVFDAIAEIGDVAHFSMLTLVWIVRRRSRWSVLVPIFYAIGVKSVSVVAITGTFIGMVLAVQAYHQFAMMGLATRLGSVINISIVRELGPVLAATMLAGRVGSAMAAELGTMRVTEQIDALSALGTNPIYYLVVPRFLACVLLDPALDPDGRLHGGDRRRGRQHPDPQRRLVRLLEAHPRLRGQPRYLRRRVQELFLRRGDRA